MDDDTLAINIKLETKFANYFVSLEAAVQVSGFARFTRPIVRN